MGADGTKIRVGRFPWSFIGWFKHLQISHWSEYYAIELTKFSEHFELRYSFVIWTSDHGVHALSHDSIETQLPRSLNKISKLNQFQRFVMRMPLPFSPCLYIFCCTGHW